MNMVCRLVGDVCSSPIVLACVVMLSGVSLALGGPLTPPGGAVASSGRTLGEIEPRTPVNDSTTPGSTMARYVIASPGSYYLTADVVAEANKSGIQINADHVTLDLNGFQIRCTGPNALGEGLDTTSTRKAISVRNGTIRGFGYATSPLRWEQCTFENLAIMDHSAGGLEGNFFACTFRNIRTTASTGEVGIGHCTNCVIEHCTVVGTFQGIDAGHGSVVRSCTVTNATTGINAYNHSVIESCVVSNCQAGIDVTGASIVRDCVVAQCTTAGIRFKDGGRITGCSLRSCAVGVLANTGAQGRTTIADNAISQCPVGIRIQPAPNWGAPTACVLIRNTITAASTQTFDIAAGNAVAPLLTPSEIVTATNPFANVRD
ncbi:MAG: right-handed parallel beta-helix repeat-containing protein [Phycisphaerales bacterium]|nr:right-handed parallel beta-helix repeat-containing protein [Phycisphaerales bacterium]